MRVFKILCGFTAIVVLTGFAVASPVVGKLAPDFAVVTTKGKHIALSELKGSPVVLEWTNHQCPYVMKHYGSGNMQRTQRELTEKGAIWISIISSAEGTQGSVTAEKANDLTVTRGAYASHVVLDPSGTLGRLYRARTTPEMFLINSAGTIEYMGAIDDKPSTRRESLDGATNYLLQAWNELEVGKSVSVKSSKPYGCAVKYAD